MLLSRRMDGALVTSSLDLKTLEKPRALVTAEVLAIGVVLSNALIGRGPSILSGSRASHQWAKVRGLNFHIPRSACIGP